MTHSLLTLHCQERVTQNNVTLTFSFQRHTAQGSLGNRAHPNREAVCMQRFHTVTVYEQ